MYFHIKILSWVDFCVYAKFDFYVFVFDSQENVGNVPTIFFFYFKIEELKMNVFSN